jgi:glycosyltransferase involved in cell wall biosynthesis
LLARALETCYQVRVVSFRRQYPAWLYPGQSDKDPSAEPMKMKAEFILDPVYPWTWRTAALYIETIKPHAIIFQWWTTFWAPAFFALSTYFTHRKIPLIFLIHNVLPHEAKPWDKWFASLTLGKGDAFIVQTEQQKKKLESIVPGAKAAVHPHPVYDMLSHNKISKGEAHNRLGLSGSDTIILFFGIVRAYKGLQYLLDAIALMNKKGKRVHLVVAGEFWDSKETYLKKIEQLNLTDQVTIHDRYIPNEEVALYFSAADVFAAPYSGGTQSGAAKMAIGFGLPLVISDTVADEAIVEKPGEHIFITPSMDSSALAVSLENAVEYSLSRPNQAAHLSRNYPTWASMAETVSSVIASANRKKDIQTRSANEPE